MAYTQFRTVEPTGPPKETPVSSERDIRSRQIDELIRISEEARTDVYGPKHSEDCRNFYQLFERTRKMPTYRPRIAAPQLQLLLMQEAADLADTTIQVFIQKDDGTRDKE